MAAIDKPSSTFPFAAILSSNETTPKDLSTQEIGARLNQQFRNFYSYCNRNASANCIAQSKLKSTVHLDLKKKNIGSLQKVSIVYSDSEDRNLRQDWSFTTKTTSETFSLFADKIIPFHKIPIAYFDGSEIEKIVYPSTLSEDAKEWNHWRTAYPDAAKNYFELIYPCFRVAMQHVDCSLNHRDLTLLDLGGSDGALSYKLLESFVVPCKNLEKVFLVDNNSEAIALAKHRASCSFFPADAKTKLHISERDITKCDLNELTQGEKVDAILLSGVIANQVLNKEDSVKLLQRAITVLKDDGFILIASHTPGYFSAEDYEKFGFEVLNKTAPYTVSNNAEKPFAIDEVRVEPFYVLRKDNRQKSVL